MKPVKIRFYFVPEIFYLLNGGRNISKDLLVRILTRLFTEGTESQVSPVLCSFYIMSLCSACLLYHVCVYVYVCVWSLVLLVLSCN